MATSPDTVLFPVTPVSRTCVMTAAEVAFNNPTQAVDLLLPADNVNGARITKLYAIPRAAIAALLNVQLYKKTAGGVYTLIDGALMGIVTPSATQNSPKTDFGLSLNNPMELEGGVGLAMAIGTAIANGVVGRCEGGLY